MLYTKKEILEMYLNTVSFGNNTFGIKVASTKYFSKNPMQLKDEEAALLVGMLKATSTFNPINNPDKATDRRNVVLSQMLKSGFITKKEYNRLLKKPLKLNITEDDDDLSKDSYLRTAVANYLKEWCEDNDIDLYADGLKIYTSIDPIIQKHAEEAVEEWMKTLQKRFNNTWQTENPWRDENGVEIPNFLETLARRLTIYKKLDMCYRVFLFFCFIEFWDFHFLN